MTGLPSMPTLIKLQLGTVTADAAILDQMKEMFACAQKKMDEQGKLVASLAKQVETLTAKARSKAPRGTTRARSGRRLDFETPGNRAAHADKASSGQNTDETLQPGAQPTAENLPPPTGSNKGEEIERIDLDISDQSDHSDDGADIHPRRTRSQYARHDASFKKPMTEEEENLYWVELEELAENQKHETSEKSPKKVARSLRSDRARAKLGRYVTTECWGQNRSRRNRCPKVLRKTKSWSRLQKPRKQTAETDRPASSAATRASSPGEHGRLTRLSRRRTRPRHGPARPASTTALPVESPASSAVTRASSPGEHGRVSNRLAGELGRDTCQFARSARPCCRSARRRARSYHRSARPASAANSPWTILNPVPSLNHASSSEVSVTQSSVEQVTVNLTPTATAMKRNRVPLEEPCLYQQLLRDLALEGGGGYGSISLATTHAQSDMTTNADKDPQTHDGTPVNANADKTPAGNVSTVTVDTAILDQMKVMFASAQKNSDEQGKLVASLAKQVDTLTAKARSKAPRGTTRVRSSRRLDFETPGNRAAHADKASSGQNPDETLQPGAQPTAENLPPPTERNEGEEI
ncbi:hypothetical protein F2Q69_00059312 [Brassica cretica]|uniref:Uncharacterized protein n=1 Tax=Brassica cretica TaxID=69181 RepID=A0A8S9RKS3_BRACR|nr:hypothetical protein F2Q69_00059312 [Brassica cretica]